MQPIGYDGHEKAVEELEREKELKQIFAALQDETIEMVRVGEIDPDGAFCPVVEVRRATRPRPATAKEKKDRRTASRVARRRNR